MRVLLGVLLLADVGVLALAVPRVRAWLHHQVYDVRPVDLDHEDGVDRP